MDMGPFNDSTIKKKLNVRPFQNTEKLGTSQQANFKENYKKVLISIYLHIISAYLMRCSDFSDFAQS